MGYVTRHLSDGERVVYETKLHWIVFLTPALFFIAAILWFFADLSVGGFFLLASLFAAVPAYIRYETSEFAVTTERVILKVGLIRRKTVETMLSRVEGVQVDQGIVGRLFGYGSVVVTGSGGTKEPFHFISQPLDFRHRVQQGSVSSHSRAAQEHLQALQSAAGAADADVVGRLERLARLRDQGVLTEEEFQGQKLKVLNAG